MEKFCKLLLEVFGDDLNKFSKINISIIDNYKNDLIRIRFTSINGMSQTSFLILQTLSKEDVKGVYASVVGNLLYGN